MSARCHLFLLAVITATSSTVVRAQHPLILERLTTWNAAAPQPATSILQRQVLEAASVAQKRSGGCIPTSAVIDHVQPATSAKFVFQGILAGRLKNGWTVTVRHPNCSATPVRYTVSEDSAGAFTAIRTNRGLSLSNESLITDTWPLALLQAEATAKRNGLACDPKGAGLGVTRIAKEEPGLGADIYGVRYSGSWVEIWPIEMCGRTIEVTVRFTADGDGGAYTDLKGTEAKLLALAKRSP